MSLKDFKTAATQPAIMGP